MVNGIRRSWFLVINSDMTRGAFIVIEGLDRSGKTTQTELLATRLTTNGVSVARRKFPGKRRVHCLYRNAPPTQSTYVL